MAKKLSEGDRLRIIDSVRAQVAYLARFESRLTERMQSPAGTSEKNIVAIQMSIADELKAYDALFKLIEGGGSVLVAARGE